MAKLFDSIPAGPTGRYCLMPSVVGQRELRFFLPDGLDELIAKNFLPPVRCEGSGEKVDTLYAMIPVACRKNKNAPVDKNYAALVAAVMTRQIRLAEVNDLIGLAKKITCKNSSLRQELAFTRLAAETPSFLAYMHHDLLSDAMSSIVRALKSEADSCDPLVTACVAGFYSAHVHPFSDGNGRWSRLFSLYIGSSFYAFLFQSIANSELVNEIWPRCRSDGFCDLFNAAYSFEMELRQDVGLNKCLEIYNKIHHEFVKKSSSIHAGRRFMLDCVVDSRVSYERTRSTFGLSEKSCAGLFEQAMEFGAEYCCYSGRDLYMAALIDEIASRVDFLSRKLSENQGIDISTYNTEST
jgi:Fic/DOC family